MHENCVAFLGDVALRRPATLCVALPSTFVLNLEAPLTSARVPHEGKISIKMAPSAFTETFPARPAAVNLANNHIFDYGAAGFEDTVNCLASHSIPFFGAGLAAENCNNPVILSVGGQRMALLGYVDSFTEPVRASGPYACAALEPKSVQRDLVQARQAGADFIVVNLHWGAEQVYLPRPRDVSLARLLLSAGADLVIGHHAHRIQPWEQLATKAIFYGLGNALFADVDALASDGRGASRSLSTGQDRPWNRRSLVVVADPAARAFTVVEMSFDGERVAKPTGRLIGPTRRLGGFGYGCRYRLSRLSGRLAYASQPYLHERRIPRLSQVRSLWGIFASSLFGTSRS